MDDKEDDNVRITHHCSTDGMEVKLGELDNSSTDHTVVVDPDLLIGPQVIDMIMNKPEFSFLMRYYSLLYQSLIPNCKLTISTLRQHISISDNIEKYIVGAANQRTSCQRLINFLLIHLYSEKDYMQFCYILYIISVMSDLPYRLIVEFRTNGNWECNISVHPGLPIHKSQCNDCHASKHDLYTTNDSTLQYCVAHEEALNDKADKCFISGYYHHRKRSLASRRVTNHNQSELPITPSLSNTMDLSFLLCSSDWMLVEECFKSLCSAMPQNNLLSIDKLKGISMSQLLKDREQLSKLIPSSSSADVKKINEKIITYLIVKLCYDDSDCDVVDESIDSTETCTPTGIQQINNGFTEFKAHYHTILRLLPDDYQMTAGKLVNYINDDQICAILSSNNSTIANKMILDCLIERLSCTEELLDVCVQLENITTSHDMRIVINKIRLGVLQQSIQFPDSASVTDTRSSLSTDQQHSMSPSINSPIYQMMLSQIALDPNSKVLAVLKKNYTSLCHCLPRDYMRTLNRMKELMGISHDLSNLPALPVVDLINEKIIASLITSMQSDTHAIQFCDLMESLVDNKTDIETLRNEILEALSSSSSVLVTTALITAPTISVVSTTVSQQTIRSTTVTVHHHTSSVPSAGSNTIVDNVTQQSQGSLQVPLMSTTSPTVTVTQNTNTSGTCNTATVHQINSQPTPSVNPSPLRLSRQELQAQIRYEESRQQQGFKYLKPPPLPSIHVDRQDLLDEIRKKLLSTTIDLNKLETTLTITGAGGFGKTTTVISLCHNTIVKELFSDGFIFIELGPQAPDPGIKLKAIYNLLTDKQCDINVVEQKINQVTSAYYRKLLVIIDDAWHVKDAEPIVRAFSNCKTILTTRMNDIEQYIPSKRSVEIGPMTEDEAIFLLTSEIIDGTKLSQEDKRLLHEIAQDVHLWPLLLSLIRGQLSHNLQRCRWAYHKAIQNVKGKLYDKGLTAFDKNDIETVKKSRNLAVKACIETTLELLTKPLLDKVKTLILCFGIGTSIQAAVLNGLWNISEQEANDTVESLWAYGLVQFAYIAISPNSDTLQCIEVHAVISQYINEGMDSNEAYYLWGGFQTGISVQKALTLTFKQSYGVHDPLSLTAPDYLKYKLCEIENVALPVYLQIINRQTCGEPHAFKLTLQLIKDALMTSPYTVNLLRLLQEEINSLMDDCKRILKDAHKLCRKLNHSVQRNLHEKTYDKLIQNLEEFMRNYPLCKVAQKAFSMGEKIIPYCEGELQHHMKIWFEGFLIKTADYHYSITFMLPCIKLYIRIHKEVNSALLNGSPADIDQAYYNIMSGKYAKEEVSVRTNWLARIQQVAPYYLQIIQQEALRR